MQKRVWICHDGGPSLTCIGFSETMRSPWAGSYLKGLNEGPQQCPDAFPPAEKLHQSHHSEKTEKGDGDSIALFRVLKGYHGEVKPNGK